MRRLMRVVLFLAFTLIALSLPQYVVASVIITSSTTIDAGNSYPGQNVDVYNPTTVVDIQNGGVTHSLFAYDGSTINVASGGTVEGSLALFGTSAANVSGGRMGALAVLGSSSATVSGGNVNVLDVMGGTIDITGGSFESVEITYGKNVAPEWSPAHLSFYGGEVTGSFSSYSKSAGTIDIYGGTFMRNVEAFGTYEPGATLFDFNIYGGDFEGMFHAVYDVNFHIYGRNLSMAFLGETDPDNYQYRITGTLLDGSALDVVSMEAYGGRFVLHNVPEPAAVAVWSLLCLAGLVIVRRRKSQV